MSTKIGSIFIKKSAIALAVAGALTNTSAFAAETKEEVKETEVIVVTGIRSSLKESMLNKREAINVSDGITAEDLIAIANKELDGMSAFMQGKLKIEGDMGLSLKLQPILDFD